MLYGLSFDSVEKKVYFGSRSRDTRRIWSFPYGENIRDEEPIAIYATSAEIRDVAFDWIGRCVHVYQGLLERDF